MKTPATQSPGAKPFPPGRTLRRLLARRPPPRGEQLLERRACRAGRGRRRGSRRCRAGVAAARRAGAAGHPLLRNPLGVVRVLALVQRPAAAPRARAQALSPVCS